VKIKGNPGAAEARIAALAQRLRDERPLRQSTFERYIRLLGTIPGITIKATVPPPQTTTARPRWNSKPSASPST
jgi:hypothetical protein